MTTEPAWIVVVEPLAADAAEQAFRRWSAAHPAWRAALTDADILIDTIRARDGTVVRRYRVRRRAG